MSVGNLGSALTLDISGYVASMQKAGTVTQTEADRMQRVLGGINKQLQDMAARGKDTQGIADGIKQAGQEAEHAQGKASGLTRELLVLTHEASQDQWKRFGGSVLVLGEYFATMGAAAVLSRLGVLGLGIAVAGAVMEIVKGAQQIEAFNHSLILTGNYAGLTAGHFDRMASSLAKATSGTIGSSRDALQAIVGTGRFGPEQIQAAAEATAMMSRLTGEEADKVAADFAKMGDGVAKWAEEHNRSMHFMTASQFESIRSMEEHGHTAQAQIAVLNAMNSKLIEVTNTLGPLAQAWMYVKKQISEAADGWASLGRGGGIDAQIAKEGEKLRTMVDELNKWQRMTPSWVPADSVRPELQKQINDQNALVLKLQQSKDQAEQAAKEAAASGERQEKGIASRNWGENILRSAHAVGSLSIALEEMRRKFSEAEEAGAPFNAMQQKSIEAEIRRSHMVPGQKRGEDFVKNLQRQVEAAERGRFAMLEMQAAQEGVTDAAEPWIEHLQRIERKVRRIAEIFDEVAVSQANQKVSGDLITSAQALTEELFKQSLNIGLTADEMERLALAQKIAAIEAKATVFSDADTVIKVRAAGEQAIETLAMLQKKKRDFAADPVNGANSALRKYIDDAANQAKFTEELITGTLDRMSDAFVNFAKTGKLNLGSLFKYMAEEYLRNMFKMQVGKLLEKGGGGSGSSFSFGTLITGIAGFFSGAGSHAQGLARVPYDGYPAILHEGEKVLTRAEAQSDNSQSIVINYVGDQHFGSNVSRSEIMLGMEATRRRTIEDIRRLERQGKFV